MLLGLVPFISTVRVGHGYQEGITVSTTSLQKQLESYELELNIMYYFTKTILKQVDSFFESILCLYLFMIIMIIGLVHKEINCEYKTILYKLLSFFCNSTSSKYSELNKLKEKIEKEYGEESNISIEMKSLLQSDNILNKKECNISTNF